MSFRDFGPQRPRERGRSVTPRIVVQREEQPVARMRENRKKRQTIVLHGKVQQVERCSSSESADAATEMRDRQTIRQRLQRRSEFSKLAEEMQHYSKLVSDLCGILRDSTDDPEAAWRAQILIRSAQETDIDLYKKLNAYEKTLGGGDDEDVRIAQTSCMKLHRDFKRSHKELLMALTTYRRRQEAEVSRLGAVGWSEEKKEDYYDRVMRERDEELVRIRQSMRNVNSIYKDLATLVDTQQEKIDELDDNVVDARENVEAGVKQIGCFRLREEYLCGAMDLNFGKSACVELPDFENSVLIDDETKFSGSTRLSSLFTSSANTKDTEPTLLVQEEVHWYTPFETLPEDMRSVRRDIFGLGKDMISKTRSFECGR